MNDYESVLYINLCLAFGDKGWQIGDTDVDCKYIATKEEFDNVNMDALDVSPISIILAMEKAYEKYYNGPFAERLLRKTNTMPLIVLTSNVGYWSEVAEDLSKDDGIIITRLHYRFGEEQQKDWWGQNAKWIWDFEQNPTNHIMHQHLECLKPVYAGRCIWLTATGQTWIKINEAWIKLDGDFVRYHFDFLPSDVKEEIKILRDIASIGNEKSFF